MALIPGDELRNNVGCIILAFLALPSPGRSAPALDGRELDADEDGEQFPLPRQLRAAQYEEPKSTGPVHFQEVLGSGARSPTAFPADRL